MAGFAVEFLSDDACGSERGGQGPHEGAPRELGKFNVRGAAFRTAHGLSENGIGRGAPHGKLGIRPLDFRGGHAHAHVSAGMKIKKLPLLLVGLVVNLAMQS